MRLHSSRGVSLAVHDFGGSGPPLLLCHATGFCAGAYSPMAEVLSPSFHVWGVDFRGHGDSTAPDDGDFAWSGMVDDVLAVIDALDVGDGRVHGFGHSMGGAALVGASLARPGVLLSAYLYEPIVFPAVGFASGANPLAEGSRRRRRSFGSRAQALWRYATRPGLQTLRADSLAAYVSCGFRDDPASGSVVLKCEPEHEARTFEASRLSLEDVTGVVVPGVVARGLRPPLGGPAVVAPQMVEVLVGASLVEYPHLGHFGPLEDPDTVAFDVARCALG